MKLRDLLRDLNALTQVVDSDCDVEILFSRPTFGPRVLHVVGVNRTYANQIQIEAITETSRRSAEEAA